MGKGKRKKRDKERKRNKERKARCDEPRQAHYVAIPAPPSSLTANPSVTGQGEPATRQQPRYSHYANKLRNYFCRGNRPFTTALIAFTAGQVLFGWWQWDATNKQWEVMVLDQRPWLKVKLLYDTTDISHLNGALITNTGKIPASIVKFRSFTVCIPLGESIDDAVEQTMKELPFEPYGMLIPPGEAVPIKPRAITPFTDAQIAAIKGGKLLPVQVFEITYNFLGNREGETQRCELYLIETKEHVGHSRFNTMK